MLQWKIGDVTVRRIVEFESPVAHDKDAPFFTGLTVEGLRAMPWLFPHFASEDGTLAFSVHALLVEGPGGLRLVVDTCVGNDKPRNMTRQRPLHRPFLQHMAEAGWPRESVNTVVCTHLHVDHVGWNTKLENGRWVPTFPNARYLFAKSEFDYWAAQHQKTPVPPFSDSVLPVVEARRADIVTDDFTIGDHARILPTPGHTPGHVAFAFGKGKDAAVFSGDLMHTPLQTRYPELSPKFDVDPAQAATTRRNFLERYCDSDTLCCTAHFPSPSAGKIRRKGSGFTCEGVG